MLPRDVQLTSRKSLSRVPQTVPADKRRANPPSTPAGGEGEECEAVMRGIQRKPHTLTPIHFTLRPCNTRGVETILSPPLLSIFFLFRFSSRSLAPALASADRRRLHSTNRSINGRVQPLDAFYLLPANLQSPFLVIVNIKYLRSFRPPHESARASHGPKRVGSGAFD